MQGPGDEYWPDDWAAGRLRCLNAHYATYVQGARWQRGGGGRHFPSGPLRPPGCPRHDRAGAHGNRQAAPRRMRPDVSVDPGRRAPRESRGARLCMARDAAGPHLPGALCPGSRARGSAAAVRPPVPVQARCVRRWAGIAGRRRLCAGRPTARDPSIFYPARRTGAARFRHGSPPRRRRETRQAGGNPTPPGVPSIPPFVRNAHAASGNLPMRILPGPGPAYPNAHEKTQAVNKPRFFRGAEARGRACALATNVIRAPASN